MTDVRILITGSRDWDLGPFADRVVAGLVARHGPGLLIVHGHCNSGVDRSIDDAAGRAGVRVERHPADWSTGRRAGPDRNARMVSLGAVACLAFSRDLARSKGTAGCARLAVAAGIPTWHVSATDARPERLPR